MDKKTQRYLEQNVPKEEVKKLFRKEKPNAEQREREKALANDRRLSMQQREQIKKVIDFNEKQGYYDREKLVVDEKQAEKIEKIHEDRIKRGIAEGHIERYDPRKDRQAQQWRKKL